MSANGGRLRIGFIPLADATALLVAVDKGFTAEEGLDVELVREVSWSNVRDKLNIGLFDAAHLIAPVAIASSLGLGHVKVPIVAPFGLGVNGNAITVSPSALRGHRGRGRRRHPRPDGVGARARARGRQPQGARRGAAHLRHDLPVLDPQLSSALLDGGGRRRSRTRTCGWWCCRRPTWSRASPTATSTASASARPGIRSRSISASASSCISSPRSSRAPPRRCWRCAHAGRTRIPTRCGGWCAPIAAPPRSSRTPPIATRSPAMLSAPNRIGVAPEVIRRTLDGRMKVAPDGTVRTSDRYLHDRPPAARRGPIRCRPRGSTRRWCAGDRRRCRPSCWPPPSRCSGPTSTTPRSARAGQSAGEPADGIGAFTGPAFDPNDIAGHLAAWPISTCEFRCTCCTAQIFALAAVVGSIESPTGAHRLAQSEPAKSLITLDEMLRFGRVGTSA